MLKDLRYAARMLAKNPAFTAVAVCSLAIGIGADSAVFSFADGMLLRPLPVAKPSGVVTVNPGLSVFGGDPTLSYPDYVDLRDRNRSFGGLIAYQYSNFGYAPNPSAIPETLVGLFVSGNFFHVLGIEPTSGRGFRATEDVVPGRDRVVVLGHDFWLGQFNGATSVIGSTIRLNGFDFTVIGIAPASFTGIDQYIKPTMFVPIAMSPALSGAGNLTKRDVRWLNIKGRLKPGVTNAQAASDLNSISGALEQMYASEPRHWKIRVETEFALRMEQSASTQLVWMLMVLAVCVLLVACANVVGLLLSRASARGREIAVRLSVGAARWQLIRQLFLENLLLALCGGVFGIAIALAGMKLFASIPIPSDLPIALRFSLDARVLLFTLIVSVASTFLFGLVPAWRSSRSDLISALKARDAEGTRRGRLWGRNVLVSSQLAISFVLLIVSAVVFIGFRHNLLEGPGFRTDHLFLMGLDSQTAHYTKVENEQFFRQVLDKVRSTPGIRSAALGAPIPFQMSADIRGVVPEGRVLAPGQAPSTVFDSIVSDGFFEVMGIPLVRGLGFLPTDKPDSPRVAVVNQHFADRFWPHEDAMGKRFHLQTADGPLVQIVGIAKQGKYVWIGEPPIDFLYLPFSQNQQSAMTIVAESPVSDASALAPILRRVVHGIDPNIPSFNARTINDLYTKRAIKTPHIIVEAVGGMGLMALVLAVIGLYGLIAYSVTRRTREIGIRMAVGADRRGVLQMILRQGFVLALAGGAAGLALGSYASHLVGSTFLISAGGTSPLLFPAILIPLVIAAMLAAFFPARRASRIDPMKALREE